MLDRYVCLRQQEHKGSKCQHFFFKFFVSNEGEDILSPCRYTSELTPKSELASKRSRFRPRHRNRRLGPMMLRVDSGKESKFTSK